MRLIAAILEEITEMHKSGKKSYPKKKGHPGKKKYVRRTRKSTSKKSNLNKLSRY